MRYRKLGRTNLEISDVGFGAWGIGGAMWRGSEDSQSLAALRKAADLGLNFIDTALAYGDGHSEQLVGQVVRETGKRIYVATKVPPLNLLWPARPGIGIDKKQSDKIRFFGISINDHQPDSALEIINTGLIDAVQVIYNIFDQTPEKNLFPLCIEPNIGVLARVPLDEGSLTGRIREDTRFDPQDFRSRYFRGDRKKQVVERVAALQRDLAGPIDAPLPEIALRFCLSHPAVSTVIPGMRRVENVEANCAASDKGPLPPAALAVAKKHAWNRNFYD